MEIVTLYWHSENAKNTIDFSPLPHSFPLKTACWKTIANDSVYGFQTYWGHWRGKLCFKFGIRIFIDRNCQKGSTIFWIFVTFEFRFFPEQLAWFLPSASQSSVLYLSNRIHFEKVHVWSWHWSPDRSSKPNLAIRGHKLASTQFWFQPQNFPKLVVWFFTPRMYLETSTCWSELIVEIFLFHRCIANLIGRTNPKFPSTLILPDRPAQFSLELADGFPIKVLINSSKL